MTLTEKELPPNIIQRNRPRNHNDHLRGKLIEHPYCRTLATNRIRENFCHVEILRSVEAGAPEDDEEEDKEDGGFLARGVGGPGVECLQKAFEEEADGETAGSG